mmetsp:Transcript_6436/g.12207  ORF Transcript_6436/g.12207 Transcript_6436/m.12207 type:complete len:322 (+) Transcript_6436:408-1373(+)
MMSNMSASNSVVKEVKEGSIGTVNSHERALLPCPRFWTKMRHVHVCVLQPGVEHQPRVREHVRANIECNHGPNRSCGIRPVCQRSKKTHNPDIGHKHLVFPATREQGMPARSPREGPEVVGLASYRATGGTRQEVHRPAEGEHDQRVDQGKRAITHAIAQLEGELGLRLLSQGGHVGLTLSYMVSATMMNRMTALPCEVRNQQSRVQHVSYKILDELVVGEGTVAAFVRHHPRAGGDGTGHRGVGDPCWNVGSLQGDEHVGQDSRGDGEDRGNRCVHHGRRCVLLKAVLRNDTEDLLLRWPVRFQCREHSLPLQAAEADKI